MLLAGLKPKKIGYRLHTCWLEKANIIKIIIIKIIIIILQNVLHKKKIADLFLLLCDILYDLVYISLMVPTCNLYTFASIQQELPISTYWASFYFPLAGLWQYLVGAVSFINFFILIHLCCTLVSLGLVVFFLFWQLVIIARGQTSFEAWKQISIYRRRAVLNNFRDVFGELQNFLLLLVVPLRLPMPADGIKWVIEPKEEKGH